MDEIWELDSEYHSTQIFRPRFGLAYVGPCGCRYQKKTQKTRPEDSSTVVKNFTTIGCIAPAEISVPGQKKETAKSAKYGLNLIQEPNNTAEMPNGGQ